MILAYRPIKVRPPSWTGRHIDSPFSATWAQTMNLLERELHQLGATDPVLQVDAEASQFRLDGQLRADARTNGPGVILSFRTRRHGTLSYPCERFRRWQDNLRAIALGLEALRKVERYGIAERGQQYAGWAELPPGIALGRAAFTVESAARFIAEHSSDDDLAAQRVAEVEEDPAFALGLFRDAAKLHHPDQGGDADVFRRLVEARDLLASAFEEEAP